MPDLPPIVRKLAAVSPTETERKTFVFVASDATVDRYGDTIDAKGWQLDNFTSNPVILLNHNAAALPVGKAVRTWVEGGQLKAELQFAAADVNPDGPRVEAAVRGGFLNAVSVGFRPLEGAPSERGINFVKQELLEISVVTVPANPNALVAAKSAGADTAWMREAALRTLEALDGPGRWVPRSLEQVLRAFDAVRKADEAPADTAPAADTVKCPECGADVPVDAKTCPKCGADMTKPTPDAKAVSAEVTPDQAAKMVRAAIAAHKARTMKLTGKL